MIRSVLIGLLPFVMFSIFPAGAQTSCDSIPPGPARTDCFLIQSRIAGQNAAIAGTKARVATDKARVRTTTGKPVTAKPKNEKYLRAVPAN